VTVQGSVYARFREFILIPLYTKEYLWVHGSRHKFRTIILEASGMSGKMNKKVQRLTTCTHTHTHTNHHPETVRETCKTKQNV